MYGIRVLNIKKNFLHIGKTKSNSYLVFYGELNRFLHIK